jgi:hypothetical protein
MPSDTGSSKSNLTVIALLLACATAVVIEQHNRILIDVPANDGQMVPENFVQPNLSSNSVDDTETEMASDQSRTP